MDNDLKRAQDINYKLLKKIDEICKKYNIVYFLDSGSLLGAVRHHDFIPWDDDVDIAFPRGEYEKLINVPSEEWGKEYKLVTYDKLCNNGFLDFISRLFYLEESVEVKTFDKVNNTIFSEYKNKICLDIIILDNAYDSKLRQKNRLFRYKIIYGLAMGYRDDIDYANCSTLMSVFIKFLAFVGKNLFSLKIIFRLQKMNADKNLTSSKYYASNYSMGFIKCVYDKSWYQREIPMKLKNDEFNAPVGWNEILSTVYGNYMKLPPKDKRRQEHLKNQTIF